MKMGRPNSYNPEIADQICEQIALGSNLNTITALDHMPAQTIVYKWINEREDFAKNYARARELRADWRADRIDSICTRVEAGELDANAARVIIDAMKWQAGKEQPKRYGDRIEQRISDGDGNALVFRVEDARVPKGK